MERITADSVRTRSGADEKGAKLLRALTVPPLMALFLITSLYIGLGSKAFASPIHYFEALFTLVLLPVLPYAICAIIPSMKKKGRKLERTMAIAFSILGYVMGLLFAIFGGGTRIELILYMTYAISGVLTAVLTFIFRFKASGHTCGASGPFAMLAISLNPWWLLGYLAMIPIFISSIRLRRHTLGQLFAGATVSVAALFIAIRIIELI